MISFYLTFGSRVCTFSVTIWCSACVFVSTRSSSKGPFGFLTVIASFDAEKCHMLQKHQTAIENVGFQYELFGLNPISSWRGLLIPPVPDLEYLLSSRLVYVVNCRTCDLARITLDPIFSKQAIYMVSSSWQIPQQGGLGRNKRTLSSGFTFSLFQDDLESNSRSPRSRKILDTFSALHSLDRCRKLFHGLKRSYLL